MSYLAVLIGGLIGGCSRYLVSFLIPSIDAFPVAILVVNLGGSLLLGLLYGITASHPMKPWLKAGLGIGVIGSFTTFSAYCVDAAHLLTISLTAAGLYTAASFVGGPILAFTGLRVVAVITHRIPETVQDLSA